MELLSQNKDDLDYQVTFHTMGLSQYHLLGRVDDAAHFEVNQPCAQYICGFVLQTGLSWSNNVSDNHHCPDQILLGLGDEAVF